MLHDEDGQLTRIENELVSEFGAGLPPVFVAEQFRREVSGFAGASVRTYVPVLAQRAARERLRELSRT
jgi:hypothetical protein